MTPNDTIAAIATPPGRGGVGVVRLSGDEIPRIATAVLGTIPAPRRASLKRFLDADGAVLDEGLALYFPAPASFTGEPMLELHGHGGSVVLDRLLRRVLELGARMARPGEFTERAFHNGKLDLAQAEAVADLIDAGTTAAARAAVRSMRGEFSAQIHRLTLQLTELRAHVEAAIDFPDEEIDFLSDEAMRNRLIRLFADFESITAAARHGALLRDGLTIVIAGRPNSGKSSLLNRLAGEDVAIVTAVPGTTRDVLRQPVQFDGMPVNIVDTAGLRTAADVVEAEGIRRARVEIAKADRILYVIDATAGDGAVLADDMPLPPTVPVTWVVNKIDLIGKEASVEEERGVTRIFISARTGEGLDLLRAHVAASAAHSDPQAGAAFSARRRHLDALARAKAEVERASASLHDAQALDLFAEDLRLAQRALGEITGEVTSEDLLGEIFASFCIGK